MNLFFTNRGEFRLLWLYVPVVLFHGMLAVKDTFIVDVFWDSVFYKRLAFGFSDWKNFDLTNHFPIPPLYSLILSLGVQPKNYILTETIQSWISPALYFIGLFPVYKISRLVLNPQQSIWAAVIFLIYPTSIYTQWTLSENLAFPLSIMCFYFAAKTVLQEKHSPIDIVYLTVFSIAILLTRIQMIILIFQLFFCIIYIRWWNKQSFLAYIYACIGCFTIWILTLYCLGYLQRQDDWLLYSHTDSEMKRTVWVYTLLFLNRFYSHWTALWIEGGLLLPTIPLAAFFASVGGCLTITTPLRKLLACWLVVSVSIVASISIYRLTRIDIEFWSVSLRHVSYVNVLAIPLVFLILHEVRQTQSTIRFLFFALITQLLMAGSLFLPEVWEGLTRPETYFTNAPTLDFLEQLKHSGAMLSGILFVIVGVIITAFVLRNTLAGTIIWLALLSYLYGCSIDFVLEDRQEAIQKMRYKDIHAFCSQLQSGRWSHYDLYVLEEESTQLLRPNLLYWLNQSAYLLVPDAPLPKTPFIYVTFRGEQIGKHVFQSGKLNVYLNR